MEMKAAVGTLSFLLLALLFHAATAQIGRFLWSLLTV